MAIQAARTRAKPNTHPGPCADHGTRVARATEQQRTIDQSITWFLSKFVGFLGERDRGPSGCCSSVVGCFGAAAGRSPRRRSECHPPTCMVHLRYRSTGRELCCPYQRARQVKFEIAENGSTAGKNQINVRSSLSPERPCSPRGRTPDTASESIMALRSGGLVLARSALLPRPVGVPWVRMP